jgi:hypothetical protein
MRLVMVVWLPLAATTSMVLHLVRISVRKASPRNKASVPNRHNVHSKANALNKHNVRHKASASSLPVVIK